LSLLLALGDSSSAAAAAVPPLALPVAAAAAPASVVSAPVAPASPPAAYYPLTTHKRTKLLTAWLTGLDSAARSWLAAQAPLPEHFRYFCNLQLPFLVEAAIGSSSPPLLHPSVYLAPDFRVGPLRGLLLAPAPAAPL